jgi:hypothetical protein
LITTSNNEDPRTIHALTVMSISTRSSVLRWLVQRQQQQQQDTMAEARSLGGEASGPVMVTTPTTALFEVLNQMSSGF